MTPWPESSTLTSIGVIRSSRTDLVDTPVQSGLNRTETASLQVLEAFVDGLDGLEEFDYVWLVTWLGKSKRSSAGRAPLRQVPFLQGGPEPRRLGIFATRGPRRVNPIGLSLVKVLAIEGSVIRFSGVDMIDGTTVIDIKPYVTAFDLPAESPRCGWFDDIDLPLGATPASLRARSSERLGADPTEPPT
jgi:tRNA (adenine37-N6)-methyltransferase